MGRHMFFQCFSCICVVKHVHMANTFNWDVGEFIVWEDEKIICVHYKQNITTIKMFLQVFLCKTKGHCIISPSSHSNFGISMQNSENEWLCTNDNNDARGNQNNINKTSVILSVLHSSRSSAGEHILTFITKFVLQYIKKKKTITTTWVGPIHSEE